MNNLDYSKVFEVLVKETANYVKVNNLKANGIRRQWRKLTPLLLLLFAMK